MRANDNNAHCCLASFKGATLVQAAFHLPPTIIFHTGRVPSVFSVLTRCPALLFSCPRLLQILTWINMLLIRPPWLHNDFYWVASCLNKPHSWWGGLEEGEGDGSEFRYRTKARQIDGRTSKINNNPHGSAVMTRVLTQMLKVSNWGIRLNRSVSAFQWFWDLYSKQDGLRSDVLESPTL